MTGPITRPTDPKKSEKSPSSARESAPAHASGPRAFAPEQLADTPLSVTTLSDAKPSFEAETLPVSPKGMGFFTHLLLWAGGLLLSLGIGLAAERLIRDLFDRYEFLGWIGTLALALIVVAAIVLMGREVLALRRFGNLDALRQRATQTLKSDSATSGNRILDDLAALYKSRPDLARPRQTLSDNRPQLFDGGDMIRSAERTLMGPLDARARALTAASARRVAIVTAISPRALVDIAFVGYESFRLARAVAALYGARPGLIGYWRLARAVLGHLAVTGGVAIGDSLVQQLVGHGLAAKLSARLGEGFVNGLMTVRVGIAAMRVTRPLPFEALGPPIVTDFLPALADIASGKPKK